MKTIVKRTEFDEILSRKGKHMFFVHSPWAGQSHFGKGKLEKLAEKFPDIEYITILNNMETNSFIYDWLSDCKINHAIVEHRPSVGPWIHGNGELFMVKDDQLKWFRRATIHLNEEELKSLLNLT